MKLTFATFILNLSQVYLKLNCTFKSVILSCKQDTHLVIRIQSQQLFGEECKACLRSKGEKLQTGREAQHNLTRDINLSWDLQLDTISMHCSLAVSFYNFTSYKYSNILSKSTWQVCRIHSLLVAPCNIQPSLKLCTVQKQRAGG